MHQKLSDGRDFKNFRVFQVTKVVETVQGTPWVDVQHENNKGLKNSSWRTNHYCGR